MAEEDTLKVYWEHFFKAETGTYEVNNFSYCIVPTFMVITKLYTNIWYNKAI